GRIRFPWEWEGIYGNPSHSTFSLDALVSLLRRNQAERIPSPISLPSIPMEKTNATCEPTGGPGKKIKECGRMKRKLLWLMFCMR
ncbi:hypothetical protein AKJ16_DCAP18632, partial [Drosera capensis]